MSSIRLGQGHVYHSRKEGTANSFGYPSFFVLFDCDDESSLKKLMRKKFKGFLSLNTADYLHQKSGELTANVKEFLREKCNYEAEKVCLHTLPRMFGYAFNPVSFWLCYKGSAIDAVLVEVHNTFGERHFYWLKPSAGIQASEWYRAEKAFHVSPFFPVEGFYQFRFQISDVSARVDINYHATDGALRLATWVEGKLTSLSDHTFLALLGKYGWITPMIVLRIHFQAVKLWFKKNRFHRKPLPPHQEVT